MRLNCSTAPRLADLHKHVVCGQHTVSMVQNCDPDDCMSMLPRSRQVASCQLADCWQQAPLLAGSSPPSSRPCADSCWKGRLWRPARKQTTRPMGRWPAGVADLAMPCTGMGWQAWQLLPCCLAWTSPHTLMPGHVHFPGCVGASWMIILLASI